MIYSKITLKHGKDEFVKRFHPWIFSGAIHLKNKNLKAGDIVEVFDANNNYLATGFFQEGSISIRIFTYEKQEIDTSFWKQKIERAFELRKALGLVDNKENNSYRLTYAESDGLPGLIADFYNGTLVLQCNVLGMYLQKEHLAKAFREVLGDRLNAIYDKSADTLLNQERFVTENSLLWGTPQNETIIENNCSYFVDWVEGQKTGFFLDQKDSRKLLQKFTANKSVLNTFAYSGGFSVNAIQGGASEVLSVDSSKLAIELCNKNVALNFPDYSKHSVQLADVKNYLQSETALWDVIILDPPAFAKHQSQSMQAMKGYRFLNRLALERLKPNAILFTFSCSQAVSKESFQTAILSAAIDAGRNVKILYRLTQAPDHPVNIFFPESEYLKGLVIFVE